MSHAQHSLYQSTRLAAYAERLIHAFTGKPLTLGGPGYTAETLIDNRNALCRQLGLAPASLARPLLIPQQVHSATSRLNIESDFSQCDAVILTEPHRPALVLAADCVPIMLYEPKRHIGAVIHAGWRGTAQQIALKTAMRLVNEFSANPGELVAVIGPCNSGCCYEVSEEVVDALSSSLCENASPLESSSEPSPDHPAMNPEANWLTRNSNQKPHVDLKAINRLQLASVGIQQIEILPHCTFCNNEQFFSYRHGENGRQAAIMMLR